MKKTIDAKDRRTTEIGRVYLTVQEINGKTLVEVSTICDPGLNGMFDFVFECKTEADINRVNA